MKRQLSETLRPHFAHTRKSQGRYESRRESLQSGAAVQLNERPTSGQKKGTAPERSEAANSEALADNLGVAVGAAASAAAVAPAAEALEEARSLAVKSPDPARPRGASGGLSSSIERRNNTASGVRFEADRHSAS